MTSKISFEESTMEELLETYRKNKSQAVFEELFTRCHKEMLKFLVRKGLKVEDAEDLLQEYFVTEFEGTIEKYDQNSQRKFINYVKHIVLYRFFSFYKKQKRRERYRQFSLDQIPPHEEHILAEEIEETVDKDQELFVIKEEMKDFFREILLSLENENHRNAVILRLCLPIRLTTDEISELLECSSSAFSTWIYRGILELRDKVRNIKDNMPFDLEDLNQFLKVVSFHIKPEILGQINNSQTQKIMEQFFFSKKDYASIAQATSLPEFEVRTVLRKGIFELLSLIRKKDLLFRQGGIMHLEQEAVLDFIDRLDDHSNGMKTRKSVTTGDHELDSLLTLVYSLFEKNKFAETDVKDNFLERLKELNLSIEDVKEKCHLTMGEINLLISGQELPEETSAKLNVLFHAASDKKEDPAENEVDIDQDFSTLNKNMLDYFYKNKK